MEKERTSEGGGIGGISMIEREIAGMAKMRMGFSVVGLAGDDGADAAAGVRVVTVAAGDEVGVAVEYALAGAGAVVDAEVEAADGRVGGEEVGGDAAGEAVEGVPFVGREVAERGDVAAGDEESVSGGNGEAVAEGDAGAVVGDDASGRQRAEGAGGGRGERKFVFGG
jgi:hypothetical protein